MHIDSKYVRSRGNRESGWGENEKRGEFVYYLIKG